MAAEVETTIRPTENGKSTKWIYKPKRLHTWSREAVSTNGQEVIYSSVATLAASDGRFEKEF